MRVICLLFTIVNDTISIAISICPLVDTLRGVMMCHYYLRSGSGISSISTQSNLQAATLQHHPFISNIELDSFCPISMKRLHILYKLVRWPSVIGVYPQMCWKPKQKKERNVPSKKREEKYISLSLSCAYK